MEEVKEKTEDKFRQVEKILYDYKFLDSKIKTIDLKIKMIENSSTLNAIDYSKDKLSPTNAFSSEVENEVIRREEKLKKLKCERENLFFKKEMIDTFYDTLIKDYQRIVDLRYFKNPKDSWQSISLELNIGTTTCHKFRRDIIRQAMEYLI